MVTVTVETGSIVPGANSYVDEATLSAYAADRGVTVTGDASELLVSANDYLETKSFIGTRQTRDQSLQWPRINVSIDGFDYVSTEIPSQLKIAQMEIALSIDAKVDPQAIIRSAVKRQKVGPIEKEFTDGGSHNPINPRVTSALRKLLSGLGGFQFTVARV